MKEDINPAHKSKINATALVTALVGAAIALGIIPEEIREQTASVTLIGGPALIATFRTWFTKP